ncbi:MAG: ABC transporter permease, partial [Anaerolineae bacterium]|nr:ABC transporter permease [Anaerolineae bacterium]
MLEYLLRQSILSLVKLLVFATILFFLIQILMPGDYVDQLSTSLPAAERRDLRESLGLDLPLGQRYLHWINDLFRLDLGTSLTGQPVAEILRAAIPPTLFVFFTGTALAFLIGLWLGTGTGWAGPGWLSRLAALGGITLFTSFPPWLAWLVVYAFARSRASVTVAGAGGLDGVSYQGLDPGLWAAAGMTPATVIARMLLTLLASGLILLVTTRLLQRLAGWRIPGPILVALAAGGAVGLWSLLDMQPLAFDLVGASWLAIVAYSLLSFGETMLIMQS